MPLYLPPTTGTANEIAVSAAGVASLPAALTFTGKTVTGGTTTGAILTASAVTASSINSSPIGGTTPAAVTGTDITGADVNVSGARSVANLVTLGGSGFRSVARTVTDTASTGATAGNFGLNTFAADVIAASATTNFQGQAATVLITAPPTAGTNVTLSGTARALLVSTGSALLNGGLAALGSITLGVNNAASTCAIGTGTTTGSVTIGAARMPSRSAPPIGLKSYTIATLPTATAGLVVQCSDLGGGVGALVADGTNWRRADGGAQTIATDAAFNLAPLTNAELQFHTGTLTADRPLTISTTGAYPGSEFTVARSGGNTGGPWNITHAAGNIATGTARRFVYDGSALKSAGTWSL